MRTVVTCCRQNTAYRHDVAILVGGGFFLVCEDLGRNFDRSFHACVFVVVVVVVFFSGN